MPYASDQQRKYMHAQKPEIAAKWDEEIRSKRMTPEAAKAKDLEVQTKPKEMTDDKLSRAHKRQAKFSAVGSGLGLTGLGLMGASVAMKKNPKRAAKVRNAAYTTGVIGGGNSALSGINFMNIERENARRHEVKKDNAGLGFATFSKAWTKEDEKHPFTVSRKAHDPEKSRKRRAALYPVAGAAGAAGTGYLTIREARKPVVERPPIADKILGSKKIDERILSSKPVRVGAGIAATGALAGVAAYNIPKKNRRTMNHWYEDSKVSKVIAFGPDGRAQVIPDKDWDYENKRPKMPPVPVKNPAPAVASAKQKYPHLKKKARLAAVATEYAQN
jgi:hypothetical protein